VRALDRVAFLQFCRLAKQYRAYLVFFEVERDSKDVVRKRQHLSRHGLLKAMNARNAVAHADDRAYFLDRSGLLVVLDLLTQNLADFICLDVRHSGSVASRSNFRNSPAPGQSPKL